jgi:disulfide bond formation protein DsbB
VAGALTAVLAAAALGTAYYAQVVLLLTPCALCLWERWPYRVVIVLGLLAVLLRQTGGRLILGLAGLVLLVGAGIAFLHVGVEFHWWNSPLPECNSMLTPGAPLPMVPDRPCDEPVFLIPGLPVSMSAMDFLFEITFAVVLLAYVSRARFFLTGPKTSTRNHEMARSK